MNWKPLIYRGQDFSKRFLISEKGDIYSLVSNKTLRQTMNKQGYMYVVVSFGARNKKRLIKTHIAVAENFVRGKKEGLVVNHKDGNKTNNLYTNLEWCTNRENTIHAVKNGLLKVNKKVRCVNNGMVFESIKEACDWCGMNKRGTNLSDCLRSENRKHAGRDPITKEWLEWEYVV